MNVKNILFSLLIGFAGWSAMSQELVRPVITGAPFLQVVPDARAGGMGETGVSTLPDVFSQFHNPSKFLFMEEESKGVGFSYIPQFMGYANDIFLGNAAYFQKLNERSALSTSFTYFSFGNFQAEEQMGNEIITQGSFVPNELAFDASYSLKLNDNFGMSVTGRYIRSDITNEQNATDVELKTASAIAADVSGYYISAPFDAHVNKWTFGFNLKNLGSKLEYSDESGFSYPLPTSLKFGGGYHIASGADDMLSFYAEALKYLVPATDDNRKLPQEGSFAGWFDSFSDAPGGFSEEMKEVILSLGSEISFNDNFSFRAGYITQNREKGYRNHLSMGMGVGYQAFVFHFAYQTPIADYVSFKEDKVLKFSLSVNLDNLYSSGKKSREAQVGAL